LEAIFETFFLLLRAL